MKTISGMLLLVSLSALAKESAYDWKLREAQSKADHSKTVLYDSEHVQLMITMAKDAGAGADAQAVCKEYANHLEIATKMQTTEMMQLEQGTADRYLSLCRKQKEQAAEYHQKFMAALQAWPKPITECEKLWLNYTVAEFLARAKRKGSKSLPDTPSGNGVATQMLSDAEEWEQQGQKGQMDFMNAGCRLVAHHDDGSLVALPLIPVAE